ncbi:MAG: L-serine ammonia-lyase, iron-sulfur-dependent, subunit beta [Thermoflavifilum sp.]|nr:L-serine ammonia-lyase, iron-sulfur-dependent, subunit beta [Thermoflavifilum sp.]MCL6514838.1 L-serine ammonia-lyase, iron-sulfur-dependent subunit beta [Alicyclobacillus sp.]
MKYQSALEIIGPVMVGPSSSHTAGAARIGRIARQVLGETPKKAVFHLMGSFAETYQGHGTDVALLAGVLGYGPDSEQVPFAKERAVEAGLDYAFRRANLGYFHPNTVAVELTGESRSLHMIASSIGGGKVEVQELDGLPLKFGAERPTLILYHTDVRGFLAQVSHELDSHGYNIARLALERWRKDGPAVTVCEVDEPVDDALLNLLRERIPALREIRLVQPD